MAPLGDFWSFWRHYFGCLNNLFRLSECASRDNNFKISLQGRPWHAVHAVHAVHQSVHRVPRRYHGYHTSTMLLANSLTPPHYSDSGVPPASLCMWLRLTIWDSIAWQKLTLEVPKSVPKCLEMFPSVPTIFQSVLKCPKVFPQYSKVFWNVPKCSTMFL